jgi:uncharacterized protein YyaL (SSP411 family)
MTMRSCCDWAHAATSDALFRVRIEETADWLMRDMRTSQGAFAASLDADSEGEEGLYYTWTRTEIVQAAEDTDFDLYFSLAAPPQWEGKPILHQQADQCARSLAEPERVRDLKKRLRRARDERVRPARDDKVLADWNGLAIAALAECGRSLDRLDWIEAAETAFASVVSACSTDGRLPHSILGEARLFPALSSDYAAMANAAIALFEATGTQNYVSQAGLFLELLDRWHGDEAWTGHYLTAADSTDVPLRIRGDVDDAIPSANAQIIEAKVRYALVTADPGAMERAYTLAEHAAGRIANQAYGQVGIINATALALEPMKLVLIDSPDEPGLVSVANRSPDPRRVDIVARIGSDPNQIALPGGVLPPTDQPGAFLCTGQVCLPPVSTAAELEQLLRRADMKPG